MSQSSSSNVIYAAPALELKVAAEGAIEGYASRFESTPDYGGDIVVAGAYAKSLSEFKSLGTTPAMLWSHDLSMPVGRWTEVKEDSQGLFVRGALNLKTDPGRRAYEHVKAGDVRGLSIGYRVRPGGATFNNDGTRLLKSVELHEVSLVAVPMQPRARVVSVKSFASKCELEQILRNAGLPARAVKKLTLGGWPALARDDDDDQDNEISELAALVKAARLDLKGNRK